MSPDDGLQDSIERSRQAFRTAPPSPPLLPRDNAPPLTTGPAAAPLGLHPFFRGLLEALPEPGTPWPQEQRDQWLETARHIFGLVYPEVQRRPPLDSTPPSAPFERRVS